MSKWQHVYALLDADAAGQDATARLAETLGSRLIRVRLPPSVKDSADLAPLPEGTALFRDAIRKAVADQIGRTNSAAKYDVCFPHLSREQNRRRTQF